MRFYSEVRIDLQSYSDEIRYYTCLVFSTDFLYHLSRLQGVAWSPVQLKPFPYLPHPMSPCTTNVVKAMRLAIVKSDLNYQSIYEELVPDDADNKLELYIERVRSILNTITENPMDAFFNLLHVGRWTVTFYDNGTKDAAYLAPYLMEDALKKVIRNLSILEWFGKLNEIAETLADLLESGYTEGIVEEAYRYFDEFCEDDEDNFDECSVCVCGHCKDLFEECEECEKEAGEHILDESLEDDDDLDIYGEFESSYTESDEVSGATENEEQDEISGATENGEQDGVSGATENEEKDGVSGATENEEKEEVSGAIENEEKEEVSGTTENEEKEVSGAIENEEN